jgi:hypothetical protein
VFKDAFFVHFTHERAQGIVRELPNAVAKQLLVFG